jgi:hypothetical protein
MLGATLVNQAIQNWGPHLSDRAFRVLIAMAVTAKDKPSQDRPAKLYFAGQEYLVRALRRERGGTEDNAIRTVKRAIQELIQVGAIRCTQAAILGSTAVYQLTLNAVPKAVDKPERDRRTSIMGGTPVVPLVGTPVVPLVGTPGVPLGGTPEVPPSKEPLEEPLKELEEEEGVDVRTEAAVVAPGADWPKPEIPPPKCAEPTCAKGFVLVGDPPMPARCPRCNSNVIPFPERKSA